MEFIIEFLFELILEGSIEIGTSRRVPIGLRILAAAVVTFIYCALITIVAVAAVASFKDGNVTGGIVLVLLDIVVTVFIAWGIIKKYKQRQ